MKGIILAGGSGTRLYPITQGISKQLMPIYDKPMIYYPLSTLLKAGINEILIITNPEYIDSFMKLLGDGSQLGCKFTYKAQDKPRGLADAFIVGEEFIKGDSVVMILGDNIFYGTGLEETLKECTNPKGGIVFAYHVSDPERYGVVEFDKNNNVLSIEEKPENPKSNYMIPGIYFFDQEASQVAKRVKPSARGELEIVDMHMDYLKRDKLQVRKLDRGTAWLDTGTFSSMVQASEFVRIIEKRQGLKIGSIEEEAFHQGFINAKKLTKLAEPLLKSGYGKYLVEVAEQGYTNGV